jgi:cell division ATPase FtsA
MYLEVIENLGQKQESSADDLKRIAEAYLKTGDQNKSREIYHKYAEKLLENKDLKTAAEVYEMLGEKESAQKLWQKYGSDWEDLIERTGGTSNVENIKEIAKVFTKSGDLKKIKQYEEWIKSMNARDASTKAEAGNFYGAAKLYKEAGEKKKMAAVIKEELNSLNKLLSEEKQKVGAADLRYIGEIYKFAAENLN